MAKDLEKIMDSILNKRRNLEAELKEIDDVLRRMAKIAGVLLSDLLDTRCSDSETAPPQAESDLELANAKRISDDELVEFVLKLIDDDLGEEKDAEEIYKALLHAGFSPGGADARKNLTTRLWRITQKEGSPIERADSGKYKKRAPKYEDFSDPDGVNFIFGSNIIDR